VRAGGGFEAGTAIGEEISSGCVGLAMKTIALGFYTTLGIAAGVGGSNSCCKQGHCDYQCYYVSK
jgi:hypothetical protein